MSATLAATAKTGAPIQNSSGFAWGGVQVMPMKWTFLRGGPAQKRAPGRSWAGPPHPRARTHKIAICDNDLGSSISASLIGRLGSSAFRLFTTAVAMPLAGLCFSSESAPGALPSWDSKTRWNNLWRGLAVSLTGVQADMRTHLIHRPARDIIPPRGGTRVSRAIRQKMFVGYSRVTFAPGGVTY